jgi:hypothetical protein
MSKPGFFILVMEENISKTLMQEGDRMDEEKSNIISKFINEGSYGAPRASPWSPITIPDYANGR